MNSYRVQFECEVEAGSENEAQERAKTVVLAEPRFIVQKRQPQFGDPQTAYEALTFLRSKQQEHCVVLLLDVRNRLIKRQTITIAVVTPLDD